MTTNVTVIQTINAYLLRVVLSTFYRGHIFNKALNKNSVVYPKVRNLI